MEIAQGIAAILEKTLISWPFAAILTIVLFFSCGGMGVLNSLVQSMRGLKLAGILQIDLNEKTKEDLEKFENELEDSVKKYRKLLDNSIRKSCNKNKIFEKIANLFEKDIKPIIPSMPNDTRCTVHIDDFLSPHLLYQLLDYYPAGGGSGRRKSKRYGIIGKARRSERSQVEGDIISPEERKKVDASSDKFDEEIKYIVENWGATQAQAIHMRKYRSYCAVPILAGYSILGVFYMDSQQENAYGDPSNYATIAKKISEGIEKSGIKDDIQKIIDEYSKISPVIDIETPNE